MHVSTLYMHIMIYIPICLLFKERIFLITKYFCRVFVSVFEVVSKFAVPANKFYDHQKSSAVSHPK